MQAALIVVLYPFPINMKFPNLILIHLIFTFKECRIKNKRSFSPSSDNNWYLNPDFFLFCVCRNSILVLIGGTDKSINILGKSPLCFDSSVSCILTRPGKRMNCVSHDGKAQRVVKRIFRKRETLLCRGLKCQMTS